MIKKLAYAMMRLTNRLLISDRLRRRVWRLMLRTRPLIPREFLIKRGGIVVAVGIPYFGTIRRCALAAGGGGRVIVIEADEGNRQRLESAISAEGLENIQIISKAAWSSPGTLRFLLARRDEDHRIADTGNVIDNDLREERESGGYRDSITVEAATIDSMMHEADVDRIDYIEITVNGAELEVIKGMQNMLPHTAVIFAKGHVRDQDTGEPINKKISEFLSERGFFTAITRPSHSVVKEWGLRQGDVYAWKSPSP
jgi:FkbM family methyltransferase